MTLDDAKKHVEALAKRAAEASNSSDAMRFSQAANNVANAFCGLNSVGLNEPDPK